MPYLPNEIWLAILPHCEFIDLWLSLRTVDQQLRDCVEQYIVQEVLPQTVISLPIALPTYDIREAARGSAILGYCAPDHEVENANDSGRASYRLVATEPQHYYPQFLDRWEAMQGVTSRRLSDLKWALKLGSMSIGMRLNDVRVDAAPDGKPEHALLSIAWKPSLTEFGKSLTGFEPLTGFSR